MIIPNKHLYLGGAIEGGGGGGGGMTGGEYNRRLQAGETSEAIRSSTKGLFGPGMSDANWNAMVQNAGMTSPTGRPMAGSDQFYQPVYQPQYKNYNSSAQPATTDGNTLTFAIAKRLMNQSMTTGASNAELNKYGGYKAVRAMYDAGGGSYDTPGQQYSAPSTPFNPYTNSYGGTGGAFPTQTPFSYQTASGQQASASSTPFSYQTASGQQANAPSTASSTPFSYQTALGQQSNTPLTASSTAPFTTPLTASSTPFSYQTASGQPNRDYGLSYSAPMQLPQYVYDTIRDVDSYQSQPVQAYKSPRAVSSGPSQAIVGRSSQVRGTPNVMAKKAAGGITSLSKKYK